jgi:hypothetical protein
MTIRANITTDYGTQRCLITREFEDAYQVAYMGENEVIYRAQRLAKILVHRVEIIGRPTNAERMTRVRKARQAREVKALIHAEMRRQTAEAEAQRAAA